MKKRIGKKLSLHRESLRLLTTPDALRQAMGGFAPNSSTVYTADGTLGACTTCVRNPDTQ